MRAPFILVPDNISNETVESLEQLLTHARKGDIIGLAFAAMLKRRGFIVNSSGEAFRNPTFSRGMVSALDDKLAERVRGGNP
jgi:hypothetical protein